MGALLRHKGVLAAIAIIVIAGIWWGLSQPPATSSSVIATTDASGAPITGASTGAPGGGSGLVETLLALRTVTLSGSIFSDPAFQNLKDFSVAIVPEPAGRPDPFAPLGTSLPVSGSAAHVSNIFKKSGQ